MKTSGKKRTIRLNKWNSLTVTLTGDGGGEITSNLKESCDMEIMGEGCCEDHEMYNNAIDGMESLVLAHACAGVDVYGKKYVAGLKVAIGEIAQHV